MKWTRRARAATVTVVAMLVVCAAAPARGADLTVVDDGWVTDPSVTPSAFAPGAARAPNGDIVVTYNTDGDGISGARVWLQRSSDDGATWSAPVLVKQPSHYGAGGSVNAQLSLTTLSDGTMLLPITENRTNTRYTDRESVTWVMRSTDSGRTWTGGTTPISFPVPMYFNASYGRVVESGRALLMPVWGAPTAPSTPGGLINPTPWQAGVLRSTDGGRTWGSYHVIGADLVAPPYTADLPANVTETVVTPLRDGRLLAVLRSDSTLGNGTRWFYQSWSSDGGLTWSRLVQSHVAGAGHDLFPVACGTAAPKLLLAHEDPVSHQVISRVSYDGGVRWIDPLVLTRPAGSGTAGHDIYPAFVTLPGNRLLVVYSHVPVDTHKRIAYNVLQDVSPATCADHAAAALATATDQPGVYVERADAADWPLPYGRRELFASANSTVASLAAAATPEVTCAPGSVTLYENGRALPSTATLAAAGIANGDRVSVLGTPSADAVEVGLADSDTYPDRRKLYGFDSACPTRMALDWRNRSLGLRLALAAGQQLTAISLRDSDASTRLTAADYRIWTSSDNQTWTEVRGWTLTASTSGGRLTHTFSGLAVSSRYVKISQRYGDTAATFAILDSHADVTATIVP